MREAHNKAMSPEVRMTRRVTFSSGHRYWIPALNDEENRARFGQWASPYNHGHNYKLDVTVAGTIDAETAMIVNIKTVDDVIKDRVISLFDGKSINDEIPHFHDKSTTTENIIVYIAKLLGEGALPHEATLVELRLYEKEDLYVELNLQSNQMTFTRSYEFAASHRLHVPTMSEEKNIELFGKCNNAAGHGHNYILEVTVEGMPDPLTGMMVDMLALDRTVEELVVDRYDHKHLNVDIPEFALIAPTSEVIAAEIFNRLDGKLPAKLSRIRLYETARNMFEVSV